MADGATFEVVNLQEWLAELATLPNVLQQRVMRGAVASGASVVRKAAINLAPVSTGPASAGR